MDRLHERFATPKEVHSTNIFSGNGFRSDTAFGESNVFGDGFVKVVTDL